jgi:hemoglobin-like flavoprotein
MTAQEIAAVKKSWHLFRQIDPQLVGDVFYSRLFLEMPSVKPMFKSSMTDQYLKLVDMLSLVVARLDRIDEITEDIRQLALRHVQYGVRPAHYKLIGDTLLWTLEQGLGRDWTEEMANAWTKCYKILSGIMLDAAYR